MEYTKLISDRYSVRKYENTHLTNDEIETILHAGHIAPTGCNIQPQRILVLNNDEALDKLKNCTKCHFNAPCAMLICYSKSESWKRPYDGALAAPVDASIVTTHMMLAAYNIGIGSCWVMHFDPSKVVETFNIPEDFEPLAILTLGHPAPDASPIDMHTKTRPIEDVVYYDSF